MLKQAYIRPRVCGICIENDKVLMLKHEPGFGMPYFWLPPGGGIEMGETMENALQREFLEETGLEIKVGKLLFINQFVHLPFHAIEFFFLVEVIGGKLSIGYDPEFSATEQLIADVRFMNFDEILTIPQAYLHNTFWNCKNTTELLQVQGLHSLIKS
jgi:8-oxo-dGTP diphosphatase